MWQCCYWLRLSNHAVRHKFELQMSTKISRIENDVQDRNCEAWVKLCKYVDKVSEKGLDEFSPLEILGTELFSEIYTLPESISKLKKVKKLWLYGSKLKRIPPEIGEMESLEYFDPYTSYDLHWFPYEIINCKNLKDSRVSTRALFGNYKNRMAFPSLDSNPVRYFGDKVNCSVCKKEMTYKETNQLWITLRIGTDIVPLLTNLCSKNCEDTLPKPPENYVQYPHKGGSDLVQPPDEDEIWELKMTKREKEKSAVEQQTAALKNSKNKTGKIKTFKLIRKLWEK